MRRDIDPENLTAGDVLRIVVPAFAAIFGAIGAIYLVKKYAPDFVGLAVVAVIALVMFAILTMPKRDLEAIAKADESLEEKVGSVPVVGPGLKWAIRALDWLGTIFAVIFFVWLVVWAIGMAF